MSSEMNIFELVFFITFLGSMFSACFAFFAALEHSDLRDRKRAIMMSR